MDQGRGVKGYNRVSMGFNRVHGGKEELRGVKRGVVKLDVFFI